MEFGSSYEEAEIHLNILRNRSSTVKHIKPETQIYWIVNSNVSKEPPVP